MAKFPTRLPAAADEWIIESGCGHDLIAQHNVKDSSASFPLMPSDLITFSTANGKVSSDMGVGMWCASLEEPIFPKILPSTPSVLSLGRRCMHDGYSFAWPAGGKPCLLSPKGKIVPLTVRRDIPYLDARTCTNLTEDDILSIRSTCATLLNCIELQQVLPAAECVPGPEQTEPARDGNGILSSTSPMERNICRFDTVVNSFNWRKWALRSYRVIPVPSRSKLCSPF